MPNGELVVSDTSPLLNLALIQQLDLLESQFPNLAVPRQVWDELAAGEGVLDTLKELRDNEFLRVVEVEQSNLFTEILHELDRGETAAICHAIEHEADLIILDEKDGRQVARRHDLTMTGVVGILLRSAKDGQIELEEELDSLREAGFWISDDLYSAVLSRAENL
jgi:predicted nucleic acid-binding protein